MKHTRRSLMCLLLVLLLAAAALTGCAQQNETDPKTDTQALQSTEAAEKPEELGSGAVDFYLDVTLSETEARHFLIHTDAETVGAALNELNLVGGKDGLYNTVCGKTLDWNADHMYWAFYVDGAYASAGMDDTPVVAGSRYALTATAG